MSRKATYQDSLKADILSHTLSLAGEDGWPGVSTRKIAGRLGTSTTAIYHYFGGKEAILIELQYDGFRRLRDAMLVAIDSQSKPKKQLKAISRTMLQFARNNPHLYALMFNLDGAVCQSDAAAEATEAMQQTQEVLKKLTKDDTESVFINWFALIQGFIMLARNDAQDEIVGWFDQLLDEAIGRFVRGL